jgi:hypothetical protein
MSTPTLTGPTCVTSTGSLAGRLILKCRGHRHWHGPTEVGMLELPAAAPCPRSDRVAGRAGGPDLAWHNPKSHLRAPATAAGVHDPGFLSERGGSFWLRARPNTKPTGRGKQPELPELAFAMAGGPPGQQVTWAGSSTASLSSRRF